MVNDAVVQVSGRGTNVEFIIDDVKPFDETAQELRLYLVKNRGMWSGGAITVNVGNRLISREQLNEFKKIIEGGSGLRVIRFSCLPETMAAATPDTGGPPPSAYPQHNAVATPPAVRAAAPVVTVSAPNAVAAPPAPPPVVKPPPRDVVAEPPPSQPVLTPAQGSAVAAPPSQPKVPPPDLIVSEEPESVELKTEEPPRPKRASYLQSHRDTALLVKSTCRSGEIIRHGGDVVVLGDVNPGAEVLATGDIVVVGCLRGFAHAGSEGDAKATIVALSLGSPRIQIGSYVGFSTDSGPQTNYTDIGPVIAYARRRSIHVAIFEGRFAKYGKGELYDG